MEQSNLSENKPKKKWLYILLIIIVTTISAKNANIGRYISGEYIKSIILGAFEFFSITCSSPLPIETSKNNCGVKPNNVAQKKLFTLTLKIQGNTFDNAKGTPPINL